MPRARPVVEFITLLPFVIPPIVLVFGLISTYSHPPLPFTHTDIGSTALLICGYVVLSFPYMYRAIDTGLRAMDIQSLTEASLSLGAGWIRILVQVILPNLRVALLSGAFLTLAIVVGEFTIATFLARKVFSVYLSGLGGYRPVPASRGRPRQLRVDVDRDGLHRHPRARLAVADRRSPAPGRETRSQMAFLELTDIQKMFGDVAAVIDFNLAAAEGRVRLVPRTIGLRQDDDPADDRGLREADDWPDHRSTARTSPTDRRTSATSAWSSSRTRCSRT